MQTKHFTETPKDTQPGKLADQINAFLNSQNIKIVDIRYSSAVSDQEEYYSALLIYEIN